MCVTCRPRPLDEEQIPFTTVRVKGRRNLMTLGQGRAVKVESGLVAFYSRQYEQVDIYLVELPSPRRPSFLSSGSSAGSPFHRFVCFISDCGGCTHSKRSSALFMPFALAPVSVFVVWRLFVSSS